MFHFFSAWCRLKLSTRLRRLRMLCLNFGSGLYDVDSQWMRSLPPDIRTIVIRMAASDSSLSAVCEISRELKLSSSITIINQSLAEIPTEPVREDISMEDHECNCEDDDSCSRRRCVYTEYINSLDWRRDGKTPKLFMKERGWIQYELHPRTKNARGRLRAVCPMHVLTDDNDYSLLLRQYWKHGRLWL